MPMLRLHKQILHQLRAKYTGFALRPSPPRWLNRSRWAPTFCMSLPQDKRIFAVDLVLSANIPRSIYREEVAALIQQHRQLRVIVCVLDERLDSFPETETFCRQIGCGLQSFIPEAGLQTVVTTDLDKTGQIDLAIEPGWFPRHILNEAKNLPNISFHDTITEFCRQVVPLRDNQTAVTALVHATVDRLLQQYPRCHANVGSYMKLAHFESMFRQAVPEAREHVLHSFRVFLAGCAVINRFYDRFLISHRRFCVGSQKKMSIEYCWLLTAIFHDVGRPLERGRHMLEAELEDEDIDISVVGKQTRWVKDHYSHARRILTSLALYVASNPDDDTEWDGGAVPGKRDNEFAVEWTNIYDQMTSHAVISAFNMLASIVEQASAVEELKNRPFIVTHATPAALAILLHDWRVWEHAKKWKLFPVDCGVNPLAALLIFVDTWDDFKRQGIVSPISVEGFSVRDTGVGVTVRWLKAEDYEKNKIKYTAFKRALKNHRFKMDIVASA